MQLIGDAGIIYLVNTWLLWLRDNTLTLFNKYDFIVIFYTRLEFIVLLFNKALLCLNLFYCVSLYIHFLGFKHRPALVFSILFIFTIQKYIFIATIEKEEEIS